MADNKITEYNSHAAPATGDQFFMIGASEEYRIDYDALASTILDKLTTKTYSGISNNVIDAIAALNSSINFGVNTSAASTEKAVYIKAVADAVAETVGITTNKSILGYVFVSGIDAFSCMGAIRGSTIRMIIVASNAATYSVVRNRDGAVTYKEIAWVS